MSEKETNTYYQTFNNNYYQQFICASKKDVLNVMKSMTPKQKRGSCSPVSGTKKRKVMKKKVAVKEDKNELQNSNVQPYTPTTFGALEYDDEEDFSVFITTPSPPRKVK